MEIGKEFTPSHFVNCENIKLTKIGYTYGGGMGGARQFVYTLDTFDLNDKFIAVKTIDNRELKINTNFIFAVEPVNVAHFILGNDGHSMYKEYAEYMYDVGTDIGVFTNRFVDNNKDRRIYTEQYHTLKQRKCSIKFS